MHCSVHHFFELIVALQWEKNTLATYSYSSHIQLFLGLQEKNCNFFFQPIKPPRVGWKTLSRVLVPALEMKSYEAFSEILLSGEIKVSPTS